MLTLPFPGFPASRLIVRVLGAGWRGSDCSPESPHLSPNPRSFSAHESREQSLPRFVGGFGLSHLIVNDYKTFLGFDRRVGLGISRNEANVILSPALYHAFVFIACGCLALAEQANIMRKTPNHTFHVARQGMGHSTSLCVLSHLCSLLRTRAGHSADFGFLRRRRALRNHLSLTD